MPTSQPKIAPTARRSILGFTAAPTPTTREPADAPQHDFLMLSLSPQLSPNQPAAALPAKRGRTRAA